MFGQNRYSQNEIILYEMVRGANDVWYASSYAVIGYRRFINGNEVNPDGTPIRPQRMAPDSGPERPGES